MIIFRAQYLVHRLVHSYPIFKELYSKYLDCSFYITINVYGDVQWTCVSGGSEEKIFYNGSLLFSVYILLVY